VSCPDCSKETRKPNSDTSPAQYDYEYPGFFFAIFCVQMVGGVGRMRERLVPCPDVSPSWFLRENVLPYDPLPAAGFHEAFYNLSITTRF
jgi:hypothetical protein